MLVNLPFKRLCRIITTYQNLGMNPNSACRDILRKFEDSYYYREMERKSQKASEDSTEKS